MSEHAATSKIVPDAVAEIRSWCRDAHPVAPGPDDCLFCYAAAVVERHRTEIYDLARLAIEGSERDVHLYVGRLAHRHQRDGLGSRLFGLPITFGPVVRADESDESVVNVVARTLGYDEPIDGLIGSSLSKMIAFQRASDILRALGVPLHLGASKLRRWCAGEVIHLGPSDVALPSTSTPGGDH